MLRVNSKTIALATSCSLTTTTQVTDERTKDDATGPTGEFDFVDWSMSSENIVGANDGVTAEMVCAELLDLQLAGTKVEVELTLVLNSTNSIPQSGWTAETGDSKVFKPYKGMALIESATVNAPAQGNATVSVTFKAVGPLQKVA